MTLHHTDKAAFSMSNPVWSHEINGQNIDTDAAQHTMTGLCMLSGELQSHTILQSSAELYRLLAMSCVWTIVQHQRWSAE